MMRFRFLSPAFAAAVLMTTALALAQNIPSGTVVRGTITTELNSRSAHAGQLIALHNVTSASGSGAITGATLYGHVTKAVAAGQGRKAELEVAFDRLVLRNGARYEIGSEVTHITENTKSNTLKEAGGALAGMLVGNYLGKLVGTNAGGLLGAAGGYLIARNNKENVTIPKDSVVTVRVIIARRQASRR